MSFLLFTAYEFALWLLTPLVWAAMLVVPALRARRHERWGLVSPEVEPGAVWVHAASLGEGRVAAALIRALRVARPELEVVRTCTSVTAREQPVGAEQAIFAPVDHPLAVAAFLDRVRPRCLVLVEAELWPVMLEACRARGIPVAVANVRLGRGLARLRAWPRVWAWLTRDLEWIAPDAATAAAVGGFAVGDLKLDAPVAPPTLRWSRPAVVAGSTHEGEEAAMLDAVDDLVAAGWPRPLLVLAPRAPKRFDAVWQQLQQRAGGLRLARRSRVGVRLDAAVDVLLLDTVGELGTLYGQAAAAFVGGTFVPDVGGHSPAEASAAGCPVVHGPQVHANPGAWQGVAGFVARTPAALGSALAAALEAPRPEPRGVQAAERAVRALDLLWEADVPEERVERPWLLPLVPLWAAAVAVRERLGARRVVPGGRVISVGSLTAGGAGKTPVAAWIAAQLDGVVVSRGYGRDKGEDVRTTGEAARLGDELVMLARRGMPVVSAPDRAAGVARAFRIAADAGAVMPVAVLDDGLQVSAVARDVEVVVVDARHPEGGGMIPAGTRRLPLRALARADVLWLNHAAADTPVPAVLRRFLRRDCVVVRAVYEPVGWIHRGRLWPLDALPARPAAVFAGVARPEGVFRLLRRLGVDVDRTWVYPDHHRYVWTDLQAFEAWRDTHVLVTTEKDAARMPPEEAIWALRVEPCIVDGEAALLSLLAQRVHGA